AHAEYYSRRRTIARPPGLTRRAAAAIVSAYTSEAAKLLATSIAKSAIRADPQSSRSRAVSSPRNNRGSTLSAPAVACAQSLPPASAPALRVPQFATATAHRNPPDTAADRIRPLRYRRSPGCPTSTHEPPTTSPGNPTPTNRAVPRSLPLSACGDALARASLSPLQSVWRVCAAAAAPNRGLANCRESRPESCIPHTS